MRWDYDPYGTAAQCSDECTCGFGEVDSMCPEHGTPINTVAKGSYSITKGAGSTHVSGGTPLDSVATAYTYGKHGKRRKAKVHFSNGTFGMLPCGLDPDGRVTSDTHKYVTCLRCRKYVC